LPGAILSVTPWYDVEMRSATLESNAETDMLLSKPLLETFRESWIGGTGVAMNDPRVNLLYVGLPPLMVYYGAHDVLAGEAIEFGARAKSFGLDVSLHSLPEGQHNFIFGAGRVPEVDQAILEMSRWLRLKLGLSESPGRA
jgi:acetyl esterase/lipase